MLRSFRREDYYTVHFVTMAAFDGRGALAPDPMRALTRRIRDAGGTVFIPCAGSSEFHALTADEIVAAVRLAREELRDAGRILCPIGLQLPYAIDLGKRALDAGADGMLVMPLVGPYLSDSGARNYYESLMDQLDCPTLIYKKAPVPSDRLLLQLADHPCLVGIKYAVNDMDAVTRVIRKDKGRLDWYCGSAERFAPFFALAGSPGYTSGAGNLVPRLTLAMHAAMARGEWSEAMRLQQLILPIEYYRAREDSAYNVSFLKYAVRHLGLDFGEPRPPYRRLTADEIHEVDQMMPAIMAAEVESLVIQ